MIYFGILISLLPFLTSSFAPRRNLSHHSDRISTRRLKMKSPLEEQEIKAILSTASTAAKKAGEIIMANSSGADVTKTKANTRDLLTMIDPLCEKIIRDTVLTNFPTHDFLGEEDVPPGKEASAAALEAKLKTDKDFLWIVDPVRYFIRLYSKHVIIFMRF